MMRFLQKFLKIFSLSAFFLMRAIPAYAQTYISPNNDGVQDELTVHFKISDRRYIAEWRLVIKDESGAVARVIANKETRPQKFGFKEFWKALFTPKQGVNTPGSITWDGVLDSGETAPDGNYFYSIEAADDNGNRRSTEPSIVVVDNTPPEIELAQPPESDKFFGAGAKASLTVQQSGSEEDLWTGTFTSASGEKVKTLIFQDAAPAGFHWDGSTDEGVLAVDGVYTYSIEATDRAGNKSLPARITNIIYSGEKPLTSLVINGSRYFSPQTDSPQKTIALVPNIPAPKTGNMLVGWKVVVTDYKNNTCKTFTGADDAPSVIMFNGLNDEGTLIDEGNYTAALTASYLNGYQTPPVYSPVFTLKRTPPKAGLNIQRKIFSPDGDGVMDVIVINQELSQEDAAWRSEVVNADGATVRKSELGDSPPRSFEWDGKDDRGGLCPDGEYTYKVYCTDLAGNSTLEVSEAFKLDTQAAEILLTASPGFFSPNGDNVQDVVSLALKSQTSIDSYKVDIKDANGNVRRTFSGENSLPSSIIWDGKDDRGGLCTDGGYTAALSVTAVNGKASSASQSFILDTVPPQAAITAPYTLFSPDKDSNKDVLPLVITTSKERRWSGVIADASGSTMREYTWYDTEVPSFEWDGADASGNTAPDGSYTFILSAQDEAGNKGTASLREVVVDARPTSAWVLAEHEAIAPNGKTKTQNFTLNTALRDGVDTWRFAVTNGSAEAFTVSGKGAAPPSTIAWDGRNTSAAIAEGVWTGVLSIDYLKGNKVHVETSSFVCTGFGPNVGVTTAPEYFSPDNDGVDDDLFISLSAKSLLPFDSWSFTIFDPQNHRPFWNAGGKSKITERITWQGKSNSGELVESAMDYPYTFTVTDSQEQTVSIDGFIPVDVLVIRDGDLLRMRIPSIIFRADAADFAGKDVDSKSGLESDVIERNNRILRRVAAVLNKFREYAVTIEGHANNVSGTEREETETTTAYGPALVPLSERRAEFVKATLVRLGVGANRLSTIGVGGRRPVAQRADRDNWWKNRRVEFILKK
ncbi:MAG: OmpA family protein [Treponema sp.]|jgi:flagellar hook assembly protein FlgD|nr:OmpA family protein [Treponema sp.]